MSARTRLAKRPAGWHIGCSLPDGCEIFDLRTCRFRTKARQRGSALGAMGKNETASDPRAFGLLEQAARRRAGTDRADIDLAAIRGTLSDLFMLDLDAAHQFPFLMSGTRLNAFFCARTIGPIISRPLATAGCTQRRRRTDDGDRSRVSDSRRGQRFTRRLSRRRYRDFASSAAARRLRRLTSARTCDAGSTTTVGWSFTATHFKLRALRTIEAHPNWPNIEQSFGIGFRGESANKRTARGHSRTFARLRRRQVDAAK